MAPLLCWSAVSPHQQSKSRLAASLPGHRAVRLTALSVFCSLFVLDLLHPQGTACRYANASFPPASSVEPRAASQLREAPWSTAKVN